MFRPPLAIPSILAVEYSTFDDYLEMILSYGCDNLIFYFFVFRLLLK